VQLADLAGLNLDPWQKLTLRSMLRRAPDSDQWAAYESLILVPRQNGKSVTLEAFDLAKLYLSPPGHTVMHTAHLFPTAMESFRHLLGLIKNTPELWAEVAKVSNAHGAEGIELKNGSRLRFAARGVNGAGRGFSPDDVVFDEAYRLPPEAEAALIYAISARPNPQLVYASSTGFADSEILWALTQRGRTGNDPSLMMAEWSSDPSLDLEDEAQMWVAVAQANPALGYRLTEQKTAAEYRKARSQGQLEGYARERLGLWAEMAASGAFVPGAWESCTDRSSAIVSTPTFAVDVSPDRMSASIGTCGARERLLGVPHLRRRPQSGGVVNLRNLEGVAALLLIVAGVALISIPAALIVAGVLLVLDRMTT
jgi:phage terminase large subunit-like protein